MKTKAHYGRELRAVRQPLPTPDDLFQARMRKAIRSGAEHPVVGVVKTACTLFPRMMRGEPRVFTQSNAALAVDIGERIERPTFPTGPAP